MDDIEILRSRLEDKAREEISFDPNYVISVLDGWRYSTEAQSTYNWRYNLNPTWQTYVPGTFPNVASNTRYYALSITVPPMTSGYSTFELGLYSREGVVGYINGEEVVRKNLPAGPVSADTQANKIDETSSFLRVVSSRRVFMSGASVLVAVEIHKDVNNTTPYTDDFKAYLIPHQQAKDYRVADGSAVCTTTSPTNEHVNNLFDNNKGTEWSAYTDPSIVITYTFNNKRREWFNQYTLTSSSSNPEYDPMTWRVEGSNDGLTWNRIDYQSNFLFTGRRQTATFKVASNRVSYNEVRFAIVATRDTTSNMARLAEIRLLATTDEVMDSNLVYDAENVVYVVGITENFAVKPKSSGFQSFAINPALPAGISIDEDSGVISGSTTETTADQVTYTVTAMSSVEGITREAHVPMTFRVCDEATSTRIDVMKHNVVGSYKESWELVCQDEVVAQSTGLDSTETQIVHACVRRGICWIHMKDSLGDAWNAGAYLEVTLYNKGTPYKLGKTYVADSDSSSVAINTDFYVSEKSDITKVYTGLEYKPSWYADQAFVTSASWSPITGVNVTSPRRHWYVYTSVTQPLTRTNAHSYVVRFYCRAGVILYINGVEKYRLNVDDATVTESTMITGGSSVPYWHTFTGPLSDLTDASNVFAFDVVNAEVEATVDFDMFVYISGSSSMMSLTEDVMTETSASSGSYSVKRIADGNWWSYALIPRESRTDSQWVGIKYKNDGRRYVNVYCVTCNPEFSRYDPTEWDFIASNDEKLAVANWTVIDSRTNVRFSKREQRLCYSITTPSAFNIYRLVMKANRNIYPSNAFAVSELELYHYDVFTQPALKYQMSEIQGYVNMPIPTLTTTASIGTVTVSPPLPAGISLNPYTGRISGTPTEANTGATTSYVFTNTRGTVTETTTVVIRIDTCAEPKQPFYIHVPTAGAMGPQLSFNVTAGNSTVLSVAELPLHVEMYYPLCMEPTTIGLTLGSTGNSWGMYYAEVMTEDLFVVGRTTYATDVAFTFYPFYTIRPSSDWKLLYGAVPDNSWKNSDFLDSTWQQLKPEAFPTLSNAAQYYRKTFTVASVDSAATVYYKFRVSAGLIAYLNGKEIYRTNIPNGAVTSETYASTEYLTPQTITGTIVLEKDTFTNGTNILAVETHSVAVPKTTKNVFSATLLIADYMTYTLLEGSPSADIDDGGIHGLSKAFDQMTSTSYESGPRCESAYMQWTYPMGSRYVVNSYTVNSSFGNCPNRFPTSWVVEGTNDGLSWSMVDYMPETITYSSTAVVTRDFYPTRNFNSYRLRVTSCKNMATSEECEAGLTINEFAMYQKKVNFEQVCQGDLTFGPALINGYSYSSCPKGYTGYRRRRCLSDLTFGEVENVCTPEVPSFYSYPQTSIELTAGMEISSPIVPTIVCVACTFTSNPKLPENLVLDAATGAISGAALNSTSSYFYTFTGRNSAGSISTSLRISVVTSGANCPADYVNRWPSTVGGTNATRSCPDSVNYEGHMTRFCQNTVPPTWGQIINECTLLPPNITYPSANVTLEKRAEMTVLTPVIFGAEYTLTVVPNLPEGLYFEPTTGSISGTPIVKDLAGTDYNITITNTAGSYTTQLRIVIISLTCPADGEWPETDRGEKAWKNCAAMQQGEWYRECQSVSPPTWGNVVNTCSYLPPIISYNPAAMSLYKNVPMTQMVPITQNYITSWSVSPQLPAGLTLNPSNGYITGTPTAASAQASYTVTASNPNTSGQTVITITVTVLRCPTEGEWTEREQGESLELPCTDSANMEGSRTRACNLSGTSAVWGPISNTCKYRAPVVSYGMSITGYKGEAITSVEPTKQYRITGFTVSPTLPAGITLNAQSGLISGTPTVGSPSTVYTVTASNEDKSTTATITIVVYVPTCAADGEWSETERGVVAYLYCSGQSGVRTRTCGTKTDRDPKWSAVDVSMCMTTPEKTKPSEGHSFIRFNVKVSVRCASDV